MRKTLVKWVEFEGGVGIGSVGIPSQTRTFQMELEQKRKGERGKS